MNATKKLYYNRKIGYGSIWGVGGGSKAQKVSENGNFADFRPHLGGRRTPKNDLTIKKYTFL